MSGFFLNQKTFCFFLLLFKSQQNQDLFLIKGWEPNQVTSAPALWTLVVSPALQGPWPLLLVPSTPFGADCSVGSCLIFSDWPKRLSLGFPVPALCVPLCFSSSGSVSVSQDGCRRRLPCSLPPAWAGQATHSLPGSSKGLFSEVVRDDHLDPEVAQDASHTRVLFHTDLPGKSPSTVTSVASLGWDTHTCARISHVDALMHNFHLSMSSQGAA